MKNYIKKEKVIQIDDAEIYCNITGEASAQALVLLHGGIGSIEDFEPLIPLLSKKFLLIKIDSRGHGRSTLGKGKLTYQRLEQDVLAVLQHLNIKETAVLGFSDGGVVGYRLMASTSVCITQLITIGANFQLKEDSAVHDVLSTVTAQSWREKFPDTYRLYSQLNPQPNFDRLVTEAVAMWLDTSSTGYPTGTIDSTDGNVLVIRGDNDFLLPISSALELTSRLNNASFANTPFAGHEAHKERPETVFNFIREFLSS
ncbi:pimeloyl-ACP methyl ester carboxylesterase [Sinobacterium caligoides]|uniref:Pimeloyl-ACP methyl ester carboxylesterase n=1 Tax=Sinobacterium caligoides TaxID=933926 RepID=A0A3N2DE21_9GAMM|nr:alpha/beta hydrolase [Sinobacterium caligoides]ROR97908.1 pimeloyl-ACP methyl ester carboxylesterase [Sinobacterium caligoides]